MDNPQGDRLECKYFDNPVVILFNPWDPEDEVYWDGVADPDEYVMSESGLMWQGTANVNGPKIWIYDQFEGRTLLTTLRLIENFSSELRSSPVLLSFNMSKIVSQMMVGEWKGPFVLGPHPLYWDSTDQIFAAYEANNDTPVAYAQCWVYAGVLTSTFRTLGIPTRPVTNFESAREDPSAVDYIVESCRKYNTETQVWKLPNTLPIWNYHVWCEAWMKRSDLPGGYDGWQVLDPTAGIGPAPVVAVKARQVVPYDSPIVIAMVDADALFGVLLPDDTCAGPAELDTTWIGRSITTKRAGFIPFLPLGVDITVDYKTPEPLPNPRSPTMSDVEVTSPSTIALGSSLGADVTIRNSDTVARDFTRYTLVRAIAHNGSEVGVAFGPETTPLTVSAGGESTLTTSVPWSLLEPWVGVAQFIQVDVVVIRLHDDRHWFRQRVVVPEGLPISVTFTPMNAVLPEEEFAASITYSNPLDYALTDAELYLYGGSGLPIAGVGTSETIPLGTIPPSANVTIHRTLIASETGYQAFMASIYASNAPPNSAMAIIAVAPCPGDIDGNNLVNLDDFAILALNFGAGPGMTIAQGDLNADGLVNLDDFAILALNFGNECN